MKRSWNLNTTAVVVILTVLLAFTNENNSLYAVEQPGLTPSQIKMSGSNNDFACNLFRTINEQEKGNRSIVVSPISVSYLLGMLHEGADGETRRQIYDVLGLDGSVVEINEYFKKKMDEASNVDPKVTVKTANCIYVNSALGIRLIPQYKADMQKYYDAQIDALNFKKRSNVNIINNWCKAHTEGMIPTILSPEEFKPGAAMYLLNAVYFKAPWTTEFDPNETRDMNFTKQNGTTVKRKMMHLEIQAAYGKNDLCEMLRLPYGNHGYSMYVLLPNKGKTINDIIKSLSAQQLEQQRKSEMTFHQVDILMPRFTTKSETRLEKTLSSMGMSRAFSLNVEFPNMAQRRHLYVSMMKQKAKIEVNEGGTKAAAVTIAEMTALSASLDREEPKIVKFHADHPFVYYIVENSTGTIYFMGTYCGD